jgi:hypothetical protein
MEKKESFRRQLFCRFSSLSKVLWDGAEIRSHFLSIFILLRGHVDVDDDDARWRQTLVKYLVLQLGNFADGRVCEIQILFPLD